MARRHDMGKMIKVFVCDSDGNGLPGEKVNLYDEDYERTNSQGYVTLFTDKSNISVYVNGNEIYDGETSRCPKILSYEVR